MFASPWGSKSICAAFEGDICLAISSDGQKIFQNETFCVRAVVSISFPFIKAGYEFSGTSLVNASNRIIGEEVLRFY